MNSKAKKVALIGMFSALSYVVVLLVRIPMVTVSPTFVLSYEAKDIIIALCGFLLGPTASFITSVIVSFLEMITISNTGFIGFFMNVISSCAFACTANIIYKKIRSVTGLTIGLVAGVITSTVAMLLWNYIMTPIFTGNPREVVAELLTPIFLPFNLAKNGINAGFCFVINAPIIYALKVSKILDAEFANNKIKYNKIDNRM